MAMNKARGFAAMDKAKQREIASKGGRASAGKNLTREARSKGGMRSRSSRRS